MDTHVIVLALDAPQISPIKACVRWLCKHSWSVDLLPPFTLEKNDANLLSAIPSVTLAIQG